MSSRVSFLLAPPAILAAATAPCYAVQYLTAEQAQHVLFPDAEEFVPRMVNLSSEQMNAIREASGQRVRTPEQRVWLAKRGEKNLGWYIVDEVYGKHEFITYAAAISTAGKVLGIEVLDYRETYGYEIRNPLWRAQFVGKTLSDPLKLDEDIKNISGATLSCRHITDGIRRLLALHALALR